MRFPSLRRMLNPQTILRGLAYQGAGVVALAVTQKYVPNPYVRWGIYIVLGGANVWYPLTRAVMSATHVDEQIAKM